MQDVFTGARKTLPAKALASALNDKDEEAVLALVNEAIVANQIGLGQCSSTIYLSEVLEQSGTQAAKTLRKTPKVAMRAAAPAFAFDVTDPKAVAWVKKHAGETIDVRIRTAVAL